ncbi:glycosyltransferase family 2 protein [Chloroflexota bacterium]
MKSSQSGNYIGKVSVIVPCYNEEDTITLLLDAIRSQTYPMDQIEVVIADGMSTDNTRKLIESYQDTHPDLEIHLTDNQARNIPAGLNCALDVTHGDVIVRLDAHSVPYADYIANCVIALKEGLGDIVGGIWIIHPGGEGWQARAISQAAKHPLGVGDARYRYTTHAQVVNTVPFGSFNANIIENIGGYDETLLTNEDYEFNTRARKAGFKIWLDPSIRSVYFARATLSDLAKQYWRYGYWKVRMLRAYPGSIRWRQALPPLFLLSLLVLLFLSIWVEAATWIFMIEFSIYVLLLLATGAQQSVKSRDFALLLGIPIAIVIMHFSWGVGFLWSLFRKK